MSNATLPAFEGHDARKSQLRITKAGDGLSEALSLGPRHWSLDDEVYLVMRAQVTQINHRVEKDSDDVIRVHTAEALEVTEVNGKDVKAFLEAESERVQKLRDEKSGQTNLLNDEADVRQKKQAEADSTE
jgi:hypothetical protein